MQSRKSKPVVPDASSELSKKQQVAEMFNKIAGKYDFLNHFLSLGIDKTWRRKAVKALAPVAPQKILDVATGTGDLAIASLGVDPELVVGVDIAAEMLAIGQKKIEEKNLQNKIKLQQADSEALTFRDNEFDAVTCAYGVRNFENLQAGLKEMNRVLRPGGLVVILEFSRPQHFPVSQLYSLYFRFVLPLLGKVVSKHSSAYSYLPQSVMAFPQGKEFCAVLQECGFKHPSYRPLTFGITTLYTATK